MYESTVDVLYNGDQVLRRLNISYPQREQDHFLHAQIVVP